MAGGFFAHGLIGFIALVLVGGLLDVLGRARNAYPNDAQTKSEMKKKRPQDLTLRNLRAVKAALTKLDRRITDVHSFWDICTAYDRKRITALELAVKKLQRKPTTGRKGK